MGFNRSLASLALVAASLAGCAAASQDYPSLAIRDAERVSGTLDPEPAPPPAPPSIPAAMAGRLDQLGAEAASAHEAFTSAAPGARRTVEAARAAQPGGESWAQAQVALAGLEAARSRAMIALADIDRIYVDAAVEGTDLSRISATRDTVTAQVAQQDAAIAALLGMLR